MMANKRLLTDKVPGTIFLRRDGKKCVFMAREDKHLYKYRFRLLDEHLFLKEHYGTETKHPKLWDYMEYSHRSYDTSEGDWYVKCSGLKTQWISDYDIVEETNEKIF